MHYILKDDFLTEKSFAIVAVDKYLIVQVILATDF